MLAKNWMFPVHWLHKSMSSLSSVIGQHYAFAAGRSGVLKQLLVTAADVDRMLGSSDATAFSRVLTEVKFTNVISQGLASADDILPALEKWVRDEVGSMVPEEKQDIFGILWVDGDAPLLSWMLKKHYNLTLPDSVKPASGLHLWSEEELQQLIQHPRESHLPAEFIDLIHRIAALPEKRASVIDTAVDQAVAMYKLKLAKKSGSQHVLKFVKSSIDFTNIRTALRGDHVATEQLLSGGKIDLSKAKNERDIKVALDRTDVMGMGTTQSSVLSDPIAFERAVADRQASAIADMWAVPMSVEPVFAFAAIALSHIALIRGIGIGKRAGLSPQDIKKVLPPFISASPFRA